MIFENMLWSIRASLFHIRSARISLTNREICFGETGWSSSTIAHFDCPTPFTITHPQKEFPCAKGRLQNMRVRIGGVVWAELLEFRQAIPGGWEDLLNEYPRYDFRDLLEMLSQCYMRVNRDNNCGRIVAVYIKPLDRPIYVQYLGGRDAPENGLSPDKPLGHTQGIRHIYLRLMEELERIGMDPGGHSMTMHLNQDRPVIPCPRVGCTSSLPVNGSCPSCGYPGLKNKEECLHRELYFIRNGRNAGRFGCLARGCKAVFDAKDFDGKPLPPNFRELMQQAREFQEGPTPRMYRVEHKDTYDLPTYWYAAGVRTVVLEDGPHALRLEKP